MGTLASRGRQRRGGGVGARRLRAVPADRPVPDRARRARRSPLTSGRPTPAAGIPEARWVRAMAFERAGARRGVRLRAAHQGGRASSSLARPDGGRARRRAADSVDATAKALQGRPPQGDLRRRRRRCSGLGVPFLEPRGRGARPRSSPTSPSSRHAATATKVVGSWLIMGDAKDYERVRARIDDGGCSRGSSRSPSAPSPRPRGAGCRTACRCTATARSPCRATPTCGPRPWSRSSTTTGRGPRPRAQERLEEKQQARRGPSDRRGAAGLRRPSEATFDPATCVSCSLFAYCRSELRASHEHGGLLIEIGVAPAMRPARRGHRRRHAAWPVRSRRGSSTRSRPPSTGRPVWQRRGRTDPVGLPGAIYVVVAKSDAAALGIHGIAVRRGGRPRGRHARSSSPRRRPRAGARWS